MKNFKSFITRFIIIVASLFAIIFILRAYNDYKYKDLDSSSRPGYYDDVTNISLYPTEIEGVNVKYIDEGSLQGFHFIPKEKLYKGVVLCYGGSEGSPNFETAERLSQKGFETYAIFMFGMKNQQDTLVRVPLEQFEDILNYLKNNNEEGPISIVAASKGAEYALNLASKYPEISNLALFAPSSYNFAGLDFNNYGSSWTYNGEELPYIDIQRGSFTSFLKNIVISSFVKSPIS